jgi:hypothetical protein
MSGAATAGSSCPGLGGLDRFQPRTVTAGSLSARLLLTAARMRSTIVPIGTLALAVLGVAGGCDLTGPSHSRPDVPIDMAHDTVHDRGPDGPCPGACDDNGTCVPPGQPCAAPTMVCDPLGLACTPCGGDYGPCCPAGVCNGGGCCECGRCEPAGAYCLPAADSAYQTGVCLAGSCAPCGGEGQACCAANDFNTPCLSPFGCDPKTNTCQPCGGPGQPCCWFDQCYGGCCTGGLCVANDSPCGAGEGTCTYGVCSGCGSPGRPCCNGSCSANAICQGSSCVPCGEFSELCCPSGAGTGSCSLGQCNEYQGPGTGICGQGPD